MAADQLLPLSVNPIEKCHIADAKPLLDQDKYKSGSKYTLATLSKKPLVLLESLKLDDGGTLKIEQRGCEDIYFKFNHEVKVNPSQSIIERVKATADVLTKLKLSKDALRNEKQILEIANNVKAQVKKQNEFTICLMKVSLECITDVKVTVTSSGVEFFYVDRP